MLMKENIEADVCCSHILFETHDVQTQNNGIKCVCE